MKSLVKLSVARKIFSIVAANLLFSSISFISFFQNYAIASDLQITKSDEKSTNRFVRVGLNKSVIIKLPKNAKDILIGNPDIVDAVIKTKNTAYLFARSLGQTNIFFFGEDGKQILALDLEVSQDMSALKNLIDRNIPGNQIKVDIINNNIVLGGVAKSAGEAKMAMDLATSFSGGDSGGGGAGGASAAPAAGGGKPLSMISITGREQVMLKVRVTEIQRDVLKQFGINTRAIFSIGNFGANISNVFPFSANPQGLIGPLSAVSGSYTDGSTKIDGTIRAMERDGILRMLAEPTLTAISGESAKFLAGGQFPVPTSGGFGIVDGVENRNLGVAFKDFGVSLAFTPVVLSEGRISLRVNTEVSELTTQNSLLLNGQAQGNNILIPGLKVRRAETTVELPSGGSMVMAGLITDSTKQNVEGIPALKNVPILGALFRSRDFLSNQSELAIIVTPYVVNPVNEAALTDPTERFNEATDVQTILFGRLNKIYGVGAETSGHYQGNVGFIVD